jgi:hypothetical protein
VIGCAGPSSSFSSKGQGCYGIEAQLLRECSTSFVQGDSLAVIETSETSDFGEIGEKTTLVGEYHETSTHDHVTAAVPLMTKVCRSSRPKISIQIHDQIQSYMTPERVRSFS